MKTNSIILGVAMLISADYAKSQCVTPVNNSGTTGTQYYVPRYSQTGAPCLQNSSIYDNGSVGIATTPLAGYRLIVSGNTYSTGTLTANGYFNISGQGVAHVFTSSCFYGNDGAIAIAGGGTYNAFMGVNSGGGNSSGSYNTHMGSYAGYYNETGNGNTTAGYYSGLGVANNNYSNNSFFGYKTGTATVTAGNNVFVGYQAGTANTYASENVAVGYNALVTQSYGSSTWNSYNVAIGNNALYSNQPTSTTTGYHNTAIGDGAGYSNTTGSLNSFLGGNAGRANTSGVFNTFVGYQAGYTTSTASNCTYAGYAAGYYTTGADNSFFGYRAALNTSTGDSSVAVGVNAGITNTTGSRNTYLGHSTNCNANNYNNSTALGYNAIVNASNKVRLGDVNVTVIEGAPANYTSSDGRFKTNVQENVKGLEFIKMLRPVTYNLDTKKFDDFLHKNDVDSGNASPRPAQDYTASSSLIRSGFIAQEVYQAELKTGYVTDLVHVPADDNDNYSIAYGGMVVPLVQAVQELSSMVDSLKTEIALLKNTMPTVPENSAGTQQVVLSNTDIILYQNEPNPFDSKTIIRYFIPANTIGSAYIVFYDMYGNEISKNEIVQKGGGQVEVNTANLSSGVYSYCLIVNGSVVETKKMMKSK